MAQSFDPTPERLTVATWNLEWFYDAERGDNFSDVGKKLSPPTQEDWDWKLAVTVKGIAAIAPDILALQEIENRRVLAQLAKRLKDEHQLDYRVAYVEGSDIFTEQDVAVLVRNGLVEMSRKEQSRPMFASKQYFDLSKHVWCTIQFQDADGKMRRFRLLNVHYRAQADKADLRLRQSELARRWVDDLLASDEDVIVLGDFNTELAPGADGPGDELGRLRGLNSETTADDLVDALSLAAAGERATHLNGKSFDRILASRRMTSGEPGRWKLVSCEVRKDACVRGKKPDSDHGESYYKIDAAERDVSDHYPVVAVFERK